MSRRRLGALLGFAVLAVAGIVLAIVFAVRAQTSHVDGSSDPAASEEVEDHDDGSAHSHGDTSYRGKIERDPATPIDLSAVPEIVFAANDDVTYRLSGIEPDGTGRTELMRARALDPVWSADGRSLAYTSDAVGESGIQMILAVQRADGELETYPAGARLIASPSFQDQDHLALESILQSPSEAAGVMRESKVVLLDLRAGAERRLSSRANTENQPAWSPDGTRIAYVQGTRGCVASKVRSCPQPLVIRGVAGSNAKARTLLRDRAVMHPAWSPDGTRLLAAVLEQSRSAIWEIDPRSGASSRLTDGKSVDGEPSWSPKGDRFAFIRDCDIWVQDLRSGSATNITDTPEVCELSPAWRPARS